MNKIVVLFAVLGVLFVLGCDKEISSQAGTIVTAEVVESDAILADMETKEDVVTVRMCHDTDNGIIKWENASVFGFYSNASRFEFVDYCRNKNYLMEFYCEDENPMQKLFLCRNGCVDGHCA